MGREHDSTTEINQYAMRFTPGQDIVVTGCIALEGTLRLLHEQRKSLRSRLPETFLEKAEKSLNEMIHQRRPVTEAMAGEYAVSSVIPAGEGGILRALWELSVASGMGLEVKLRAIPIRQETVEVCEALEINPYYLLSGGCLLVTAGNGHRLAHDLEESGCTAKVIGRLSEGNDKIIYNEEGKGFLNRPQADEYIRFCRNKNQE